MELVLEKNNSGLELSEVIQLSNNTCVEVLNLLNLPTDKILSNITERKRALKLLPDLLEDISELQESRYISNFFVAVISGLFDAALNYLWDETINELRKRVINGELEYFFDVVISDSKRKDFKEPSDLIKLDDASLISGALKIDLITQVGYKQLDHIRNMRNLVSAAHPNMEEITGISLISWLEICIKEVISTPVSSVQIKIQKLLKNIKDTIISTEDAAVICSQFNEFNQEKCDLLAKGLFGIYIESKTTQQTISNINLLAPNLWNFVSEQTRFEFGIRCTTFLVNKDEYEHKMSSRFLEITKGLSYLPKEVKVTKIKALIERLYETHNAINNFYNEKYLAKELELLIGEHGDIPDAINLPYVQTLIYVYLSNGLGISWNADPIYIELIKKFNPTQSYLALTSFRNDEIRSKLQFSLCKKKFEELLELLRLNITAENIKLLLNDIKDNINSLSDLGKDDKLMKRIEQIDKNYRNM